MDAVQVQLHGYRHGHQLWSSSTSVGKEDQATIDQLSDVAGPLRPKEHFEPYLTTYPLPSGSYYVVARTWQDLTVDRAGCVRTLSLLIPSARWAHAAGIEAFLQPLQLRRLPDETDVRQLDSVGRSASSLPVAEGFNRNELVEALFLEGAQPAVIFDCPCAELVAVRVLTALWPAFRSRYALSTFALSPRRIAGRDFDLVFSPSNARARFADWAGRRVNAADMTAPRHRWTAELVTRLFDAPRPRLLSTRETEIAAGVPQSIDEGATLRIGLLWTELEKKLHSMPIAALGLLDLAASGRVNSAKAIGTISSSLADAIRQAPLQLSEDEARDFLLALIRKSDAQPEWTRDAIADAVCTLTTVAPSAAFTLIPAVEPAKRQALLPIIARCVAGNFFEKSKAALQLADPRSFSALVAVDHQLASEISETPSLLDRVSEITGALQADLANPLAQSLLPKLTEHWQLPAAESLIRVLDERQVATMISHFGKSDGSGLRELVAMCVKQAIEVGGQLTAATALAALPPSLPRAEFLLVLLRPSVDDISWLLVTSGLKGEELDELVGRLLWRADTECLAALLGSQTVGDQVLRIASRKSVARLKELAYDQSTPLDSFVSLIWPVLRGLPEGEHLEFAYYALARCLAREFSGDQDGLLRALLDQLGDKLDARPILHRGLTRNLPPHVVVRNLKAFAGAAPPARRRIEEAIEDIARLILERQAFDLGREGSLTLAGLLTESLEAAPANAIAASGGFLSSLIWQRDKPVSPLLAAAFPIVYAQLPNRNEDTALTAFIPFFSWDRRKSARAEIVSAFLSSSWDPVDLAIAACRSGDATKIIREAVTRPGSGRFIAELEANLGRLSKACAASISRVLATGSRGRP